VSEQLFIPSFHLIVTMLQALHSALAPEVAPFVDFKHHWNMFLGYYAKQPLGHKSRPVEGTNLVFHLNAMLKILMHETTQACSIDDENSDDKEMIFGPCLEYLIERQILDILSSLCQADVPPGIRPYIYRVFVFLVKNLRIQQLGFLPHVNVYLPIRRLLMLSCVGKASPTESQELSFLSALVFRMKTDPELLSLFAHDSRPGYVSHYSSRRSSNTSAFADMAQIKTFLQSSKSECGMQALPSQREDIFEKFESQHLIVACLINFFDSADYMVAFRAMELLLVVCQLQEHSGAAENAVLNTPLCSSLADRMSALFRAIPSNVDPGSLEEICVNWMEEAHHLQKNYPPSSTSSEQSNLQCRLELVGFFCWLDFCDSLVKESVDVVSRAVAASLIDDFFVACIEGELLDAIEGEQNEKITYLLAFISQCWTHIRSETLAIEFGVWLIGNPAEVSKLPGRLAHPLKHRLVALCSSADQDVSLEALRTFDILLSIRPRDSVLQSLALIYLEDRGYLDRSVAESSIASWSDEEDEREMRLKGGERMIEISAITSQMPGTCTEAVPYVSSRTLAPSNIGRIINKWLYLVPFNEFRPSIDGGITTSDSGFDQYVKNAEKQVKDIFNQCSGFTEWPREAVFQNPLNDAICGDRDSSDSRAEDDALGSVKFYEGDFFECIFNLVSSLLNRDYAQNLQMTAIVSRLAMFPHPYLHEFLLNPTLSTSSSARTLYSVIRSVLDHAKTETEDIEDLPKKISMCRRTLVSKGGSERLMFPMTSKETRIIDGLIVLEEFGKELAAIALVKYHMAC